MPERLGDGRRRDDAPIIKSKPEHWRVDAAAVLRNALDVPP